MGLTSTPNVGWHSPLELWNSNSTQHWQQGAAGALQDVHAVSRLKSRWPTYPWLSLLWCSHGGRSGAQIKSGHRRLGGHHPGVAMRWMCIERLSSWKQALFDFLAKTIIHFISKEASLGFECLNLNQQRDIGFTFSFPVHQTKVNHGALVAWTKGFKITDLVAEDVVEQLQTALAEMDSAHAQVVCLLDSGSPDFKHKVTKKALWIDGCYTPA